MHLLGGTLTLLFATLVPGTLCGISYLAVSSEPRMKKTFNFLSYILAFPFMSFGYTVAAFLNPDNMSYKDEQIRLKQHEVYFEAAPQIIIQFHVLVFSWYNPPICTISILSLLTSLLTLIIAPIIIKKYQDNRTT